jgi:hypothetical protein
MTATRRLCLWATMILFVCICSIVVVELGSFIYLLQVNNKHITPGLRISVTGRPVNGAVDYKSGPFSTTYRLNNYGFRDEKFLEEKNPHKKRIVIIGDSFSEGWGVHQEETYSYKLRKMITENKLSNKLEIMNFSLQGTGPGYASCLYEQLINQFDVDLLIFASFIGNDFENATAERKRQKCLNNLNPISKYLSFPYSKQIYEYFSVPDLDDSSIAGWKNKKEFQLFTPELRRKIINKEIHMPLLALAQKDSSYIIKAAEKPSDENIKDYKDFLASLKNQLIATESDLWVIPIPISSQVSDEQFVEFSEMGFDIEPSHIGSTERQKILQKIAGNQSIELFDPFYWFMKESKEKRLYLDYDAHINANGHDLLARFLFEKITNSIDD